MAGLQKPPPLPVSVISGYLGAGKTTLVNRLLAGGHGQRIMVLVNDFGEIALDESLIESRDDDIIALANGCMCCQIGGDLYDAIDKILGRRTSLDHLLIETSGVADPSKIGQIAIAEPDLQLRAIVTLVDVQNFLDGVADPLLSDTLERQVRGAHALLLTKIGTHEDDKTGDVAIRIAEMAAEKPLFRDEDQVLAMLLDANDDPSFVTKNLNGNKAQKLGVHSVPFESWNWQGETAVSRVCLEAFLNRNELQVFRAKGQLLLADGSAVVVHKVGKQVEITRLQREILTSRLVCIGLRGKFSRSYVEEAWQRCLGASG
ncbi:MAG: GTP-binding protein [Nitratireductor sp.]